MNTRMVLSGLSGLLQGTLNRQDKLKQDEWRQRLFNAQQERYDRDFGLRQNADLRAQKSLNSRLESNDILNQYRQGMMDRWNDPAIEAQKKLEILNGAAQAYGAGVPFPQIREALNGLGMDVTEKQFMDSINASNQNKITTAAKKAAAASGAAAKAQAQVWLAQEKEKQRQYKASFKGKIEPYNALFNQADNIIGKIESIASKPDEKTGDINNFLKLAKIQIKQLEDLANNATDPVVSDYAKMKISTLQNAITAFTPQEMQGISVNTPTGGKQWTPFQSDINRFSGAR